jgi:hypothetical protein
MDLAEFASRISGFENLTVADKILVIGYFLHTVKRIEKFRAADINARFDELHIKRPTNANSQIRALTQNSRLLGTTSSGFRLSSIARARIAEMSPSTIAPKGILVQLDTLELRIADPLQRVFLHEANVCFRHEAYRAAIVMAWNLAYHYLCTYIHANHLTTYNLRLPIQFKNEKPITKFTDFEDTKESIVVAVAKGAGIISSSTAKILKAKLDIRNTAAHPSSATILPITAEEVISDLVQNILLNPAL